MVPIRPRGVGRWWAARPARPFRDLHLAGLAGVGLYLAAAAFFYRWPAAGDAARQAFLWPFLAALVAAFAVAYRAVRAVPESPRLRRVVGVYAVTLTGAAAVVPAFHSTDLYVYVSIGWQQAGYGVNPYQTLLYEMPAGLTDPMFWQEWQYVPCSYGFLFALEARAACSVSGPDHAAAVAVLKLVAAVCFLLLGAVVWAGGRAAGRSAPVRGAFLVLWNPLLLLHGVSNAHNDVQFALGVAVAVLGFLRGRWLVVFPALAAAALVKYLSVVVVPFFLLASVRRFGCRRTAASCAAALGLAAACWWPYRDGFDASYFSRMGANLSSVHTSLASLAVYPLDVLRVEGPAREWFVGRVKLACSGAFAAFAGTILLARLCRGGRPADLVRDAVLILLAVLLASPKFHSWYLAMVLPLAVWLPPSSRLRRAALALGVANLLSFTFVYQAQLLNALVLIVLPLAVAYRSAPPASAGVAPPRVGSRRPAAV